MPGSKRHALGVTGRTRRATTTDNATKDDQCHPRKIFVGGLANGTTTQDLRSYFGRFGGIVDAVVLRWPDGRSRGFGYVTFSDAGPVSGVLSCSHTMGGQEVDVRRAVPGTNKLFVGGLPQNTTAAELREHFEAYGVVSDAVVMMDPATGRSRGFGFVCFVPGAEGADALAATLEQYRSHRIRGKWVEVKSAASPHKITAQESADSSTPGLSPARTPTPCSTPPMHPALSGQVAAHDDEDSDETEVQYFFGIGRWTEPQKVPLPSGVAAIGAPPGLDEPPVHTVRCGAVQWPGELAAAATAYQSMWWPTDDRTGALRGLPSVPVDAADFQGLVGYTGMPKNATASSQIDFDAALKRSLQDFVRLRGDGIGCHGTPGLLARA
jgi:hypothetical protein